MSDAADNLDALPDAALSEVFAVEVAGWRARRAEGYAAAYEIVFAGGSVSDIKYGSASHAFAKEARFATSADAVMPFLEAYPFVDASRDKHDGGGWSIGVGDYETMDAEYGTAPTFARAACIALIRAKRAEKGTR